MIAERRKYHNKLYRLRHRDQIREQRRQHRLEIINKDKDFDRDHYLKYRESYKKRYEEISKSENYKNTRKQYRKNNKILFIGYANKRRAKIKSTDITSSWLKRLYKDSETCPLCGCKMDANGRMYPSGKQLDHILPINIGGWHTKDNVRIVCLKCNLARPKDGSDILQLLHASI